MRSPETYIGNPVLSLQTMLRVISKADNTIPTVIPDGIYGPETMRSVSAAQSSANLPVTGVTDERTWNAITQAYEDAIVRVGKAQPIEVVFEPNQRFRLGDESPWLYLMQAMLTYLALLHAPIGAPSQNGTMDNATSDALKGFQVLAGLPPTGELDRQTWRYLVHHFTLNALIKNELESPAREL